MREKKVGDESVPSRDAKMNYKDQPTPGVRKVFVGDPGVTTGGNVIWRLVAEAKPTTRSNLKKRSLGIPKSQWLSYLRGRRALECTLRTYC